MFFPKIGCSNQVATNVMGSSAPQRMQAPRTRDSEISNVGLASISMVASAFFTLAAFALNAPIFLLPAAFFFIAAVSILSPFGGGIYRPIIYSDPIAPPIVVAPSPWWRFGRGRSVYQQPVVMSNPSRSLPVQVSGPARQIPGTSVLMNNPGVPVGSSQRQIPGSSFVANNPRIDGGAGRQIPGTSTTVSTVRSGGIGRR